MSESDDMKIDELEKANRELRQANLDLSRELVERAQEIAAIRGSLRWRLLRPFEGWGDRFRRRG